DAHAIAAAALQLFYDKTQPPISDDIEERTVERPKLRLNTDKRHRSEKPRKPVIQNQSR
ncbi:MAG: ATP-dependent helicase, partial [Moorea sp. SIO3H5]|nr:ATP-dependent helicase [Moorena sp. SIO3H5]